MTTRQYVNDVDPDGDVVLVVGKEKLPIKVNLVILKRASKVFEVMFSMKFKEGNQFAQRYCCRRFKIKALACRF